MSKSVQNRVSGNQNAAGRILLMAGLAFIMGGILVFTASDAFALRVTMKRIIFEGNKRTELLTIVNNTAEEQVYRLGWRNMRMTPENSLQFVEEGDPADDLKSAENMIKYAPRRVVLPPGGSQQVRLMLRRPRDLAPGEYRSHFWIQPEAEAVKFAPMAKATDKPQVQIKMLTGLTLPVFVRAGDLNVSVNIEDLKASREGDSVKTSFTLTREGNRSVYGDFEFLCDGVLAREVRGVALYTEVDYRKMKFEFPLSEKGLSSCQALTVTYKATEDDEQYQGAVMAEATTRL